MTTPQITVKHIKNCARCSGEHEDLMCASFTRPVAKESGGYTHWALCPNTGEPILIIALVIEETA
jgi:hypothetical protein